MPRVRFRCRIPAAPVLFLALWAVLLCSVPAMAADQTNPAGNTITKNPGMAATADGDRLTNNGAIKATATGGDPAVGMGDPTRGIPSLTSLTLTNSGSIEANASSDTHAVGMRGGDYSTLTNSGAITARATTYEAYGMYSGAGSTLANSGAITANATSTGRAYGMSGGAGSTLTNSGAITASATGGPYAYGMYSGTGSSLANYGSVTATGRKYVYGMYGGAGSTLANSGAISASATGDNGEAYGMSGSNNNTLTNSGSITAFASGNSGQVYGMRGGVNSSLTNSGTITAFATDENGYAYGMSGGDNSSLDNTKTITAIATTATGKAYGMALYSGTVANYGLVRVSAANPANAWEVYGTSDQPADTVSITDWATDLRDFTTYKFFGSEGAKLDLDGSRLTLRPGAAARGFAWGREYAVADMADQKGQGAVASVTQEVPWVRARLTGTDWRDQKLSLHPNFTRKTNIGQNVASQGIALVLDQMRGMDGALGLFRNTGTAPVAVADSGLAAFPTASGPDSGWSGFLTPYFSYVDNSALDYDSKIAGFMAGATRRFNDAFAAGIHVGFSHADVSADLADQDGDTLTGLLGLHGIYSITPEWYLRGQLTGFISRASNDWKSGLPVYPLYADADVDSRGVYASLNTGYAWRINASNTITPELGLSWLWSHQDAYSLKWEDRFGNRLPGYDLDYKAEDYTALYGTAMVRWQGAFALGDSVFRPSLGLGLRQTLTDNDIKSRLTTNGSSFGTRVSEDDTTALAEAGFVWQRGITSVGLTYTGGYGDEQTIHTGWLTLRVEF